MQHILKDKRVQLTLVAALSGLSGAAVGYIYADKKLSKIYADQAQADINEMKEHYASEGLAKLRKEGDFSDPVGVLQKSREERYDSKELEALAAHIESQDYALKPDSEGDYTPYKVVEETENRYVEPDPTVDVPPEANIWQSADPEEYFNWDEELKTRESNDIYVITRDEFMNQEAEGYGQDTITYFEGDETLADSRDQIVHNINGLCGETNLYRFGHGSGDPNVVYIRNVPKELELEVLRSDGKYSEEVLGFIQHSYDGPKIRKFRGDHE